MTNNQEAAHTYLEALIISQGNIDRIIDTSAMGFIIAYFGFHTLMQGVLGAIAFAVSLFILILSISGNLLSKKAASKNMRAALKNQLAEFDEDKLSKQSRPIEWINRINIFLFILLLVFLIVLL